MRQPGAALREVLLLLRNSLFLIATACYGQAALENFWEMDVAQADKLAWDSHGTAVAYGGDIAAQTTIFGGGIRSTRRLGMSAPTSPIDRSGSYTFGVWTIQSGNAVILFISGSLSLRFNAEPTGRPQVLLTTTSGTETFTMSAPFTCTNSAKCLVWVAWDATAGQIKLARNDSPWESFTPTGTFAATAGSILEFAEGSGSGSTFFSPTVGRSMFFTGVADDTQRTNIYNGGNGQPYTYFNASGYTPPTRPLTVTYQGVFAQDTGLTNQGLYWLRPWKISTGVYFWVRSTDHQSTAFAKGGIYGAYSASPETFPDDSDWSLLFNSDLLSSSDPTDDWLQVETPHLVWNPESSLWHMYCHALSVANTYNQATHLLTSPDLATWTWVKVALPIDVATNRNHTGYAVVSRLSSTNWVAVSNNPGLSPFSYFLWSSTDGITWAPQRATHGNILNSSSFPYAVSYSLSSDLSKAFWNSVSDTVNQSNFTLYEPQYWFWPLFEHDGTGTGSDYLQDVRAYEENGTVYLYAKWSYQEPSTIRLYKGTLPQSSSPRFGGALRIGGAASVK